MPANKLQGLVMTDDRIIDMLLDRFDKTDGKIDRLDMKIDSVEESLAGKLDRLKDDNNQEHAQIRAKINEDVRKHDVDIVELQGETRRTAGKLAALVAAIISLATSVGGYFLKGFIL